MRMPLSVDLRQLSEVPALLVPSGPTSAQHIMEREVALEGQ